MFVGLFRINLKRGHNIFNPSSNKSEQLIDMIALIEKEFGKKAALESKPMQTKRML